MNYDWFGGGFDRLARGYDRGGGGYDRLARGYDRCGGVFDRLRGVLIGQPTLKPANH